MSVAELDAQAQALRAEGLLYREIAVRMGETTVKAWKRCNRERERSSTRAYKTRNREVLRAYDRAYADRHRATCPHCGHVYKSGSGTKRGLRARVNFAQCPGCREHRREWIVGMWDQGATIAEIAEPLGWTEKHVGVEMNRMRKLGYPLPYRYKLKARA